eukprot:maker-scaffold_2-snap-gene-18.0-mRNA-1 protein AED:0.02 eAED:0.02 QI:92/1/1/1/1/1/3/45/491
MTKRLRIALVSDFFYPRVGGVEMHIWSLAQCLLRLGHHVIILTHAYREKQFNTKNKSSWRKGLFYMTNYLKVYYLPLKSFLEDNTYPTFFCLFPLFRKIMLEEDIQIVHGHGAASSLVHECMLHAKTMGLKTCYTDHSLFSLDDVAGINLNKVLRFMLNNVDRSIAVSYVCRENLVIRTGIKANHVYVIPNAVDSSLFIPKSSNKFKNQVQSLQISPTLKEDLAEFLEFKPTYSCIEVIIVFVGRLAYRKGIDLLAKLVQRYFKQHPVHLPQNLNLKFLVAGDGPKRMVLQQLIETEGLAKNLFLLGSVPYSSVPKVLALGDIFLNCSLTESFGSACIEAACCGLYVVATGVGGVPEILPPSIQRHTNPGARITVDSILSCLEDALDQVCKKKKGLENILLEPKVQHQQIKSLYNWRVVAKRTVGVYEDVLHLREEGFLERCTKHKSLGLISQFGAIMLLMLDVFFLAILKFILPEKSYKKSPDIVLESGR